MSLPGGEIGTLLTGNPFIALGAAFLGGVITSANPCVIVAVPLVMGYTGGYGGGSIRRSFGYSLLFVAGLTFTLTLLGVSAAIAGTYMGMTSPLWRGGLAVLALLLGLHLLDLFRIPLPSLAGGETGTGRRGPLGALLLGLLAGVASSPCATPVLVFLLGYIAAEGNVLWGTVLMLTYALGHSMLLLAAGTFSGAARWLVESRSMRTVGRWSRTVAGILLMAAGVWLFYGVLG